MGHTDIRTDRPDGHIDREVGSDVDSKVEAKIKTSVSERNSLRPTLKRRKHNIKLRLAPRSNYFSFCFASTGTEQGFLK